MNSLLAIVIAYMLGSVPSAYYAGKWIKGVDLRTAGSGNLGFTNALRVLGLKWSIPVLLFDVLKGAAAIFIAFQLTSFPINFVTEISYEEAQYKDYVIVFSGLVAIIGHNWTIFLGFKGGGKGVATSAGVFLALTPIPFFITLAVFLVILFSSRYMSLASILGAVTLAVSCYGLFFLDSTFAPNKVTLGFVFIAALLVIIRHTGNMKRLLAGTENKFSLSKRKEAVDGNHSGN